MLKNIPKLAWIFTSFSGTILATGTCISMVKSSNLKIQLADFQVESTANLSKVVSHSKDLEQAAILLQEKDEKYKQLEEQVKLLKKHNQPITMLEPALSEINDLNAKTNLSEIKAELEETAEQAEQAIEAINEQSLEQKLNPGDPGDRQKQKSELGS